jgi:Transglycosylase SLT domain
MQRHAMLLARIEQQFGVPATLLMAIWTMETDNGTGDMGKLPVIRTLATLAHDCRRTELFQRELIAALRIVRRVMRAASMLSSVLRDACAAARSVKLLGQFVAASRVCAASFRRTAWRVDAGRSQSFSPNGGLHDVLGTVGRGSRLYPYAEPLETNGRRRARAGWGSPGVYRRWDLGGAPRLRSKRS